MNNLSDITNLPKSAWINHADLLCFVAESNRIENIIREPTDEEINAHLRVLNLDEITVGEIRKFVSTVQPGALLRDKHGLNVRIGDHHPPVGSPEVGLALRVIAQQINNNTVDPYTGHQIYENLHPFTDGNGRSGRVLWLWHMLVHYNDFAAFRRGFLHSWYYQSLSSGR